MNKAILFFCFFTLACTPAGWAQSACHSGQLHSNAKKVLPLMPDLTLEQERSKSAAQRRRETPPVLNPVPASRMKHIKITADSMNWLINMELSHSRWITALRQSTGFPELVQIDEDMRAYIKRYLHP